MEPGGRPRRRLSPAVTAAADLAAAAADAALSPRAVMAAVVAVVARRHHLDRAALGPLGRGAVSAAARRVLDDAGVLDADGADDGPDGDVDRLGLVHQALVAPGERRRRGVHYTPRAAADALSSLALDKWTAAGDGRGAPGAVVDPACGGGAFLVAVARALHARGVRVGDVLGSLRGIDVDPLAVDVTAATLALWAAGAGFPGPPPTARVALVADALDPATSWSGPQGGAPDMVVGNPPFGGQLRHLTARSPRPPEPGLRRDGYADTAVLFLRRACDEVDADGVVALVQPLSMLAARDAAGAREAVGEDLRSLWVPDGGLFDAAVHVCAPVVRAGAGNGAAPAVVVRTGPQADAAGEVPWARLRRHGSWAPLWAQAAGVPPVELGPAVVGDRCRSGAGFRDEFYGVVDLVVDGGPSAQRCGPPAGSSRVVTSGLLEWATTAWGRRSAVLGGTRFDAPTLEVDAVRASSSHRLARVVGPRTAPKVLVATQTRVVEAIVDADGGLWPSVPVVSVWLHDAESGADAEALTDEATDGADRLWLVAAALMAPPVTAWAVLESGGTARSAGALKLSARQVLRAPLPVDGAAWAEGAALLRAATRDGTEVPEPAAVVEVGRVLTAAHGLRPRLASEVERWWWARHPLGGSGRNYR